MTTVIVIISIIFVMNFSAHPICVCKNNDCYFCCYCDDYNYDYGQNKNTVDAAHFKVHQNNELTLTVSNFVNKI
jgi:hypothetical protein